MITNLIELNDFIVLIEESDEVAPTVEYCQFDEYMVGIAFYGSGRVDFEMKADETTETLTNQRGTAVSFIGKKKTTFVHKISPEEPLKSVTVFSKVSNIKKLPLPERDVYENGLRELLDTKGNYAVGPILAMTPEMFQIVQKVFENKYNGSSRVLFLKSQVTELLSHYFALLASPQKRGMKKEDALKIYQAKNIVSQALDKPPSLSELSKTIGMNSNKLKKNFKEMFGVPVFKYLQDERLTKAHSLLREGHMSVQEVAWFVGYESLSSFSNAFRNKFGTRPSAIKSLSNKS